MLRELAPATCRVDWSPIEPAALDDLTGAEHDIVGRAVASRRSEFAAGRMLLRRVLGSDVEILRRPNGAPALPPGFVGSLAHDRDVVVAAVARVADVAAIGIDVEPDEPIERAVADLVVRPDDVVTDALTAFVAKEAAYKAWSWRGGGMLEHHDVRLVVDDLRFTAVARGEVSIAGRLGRADGRVVALAVSPAS